MKRFLFTITLCALMSAPTFAVLVVEFSPGSGYWSYDGAGTLSINQTILVDRGLSTVSDALVSAGATITLPDFEVSGAGTLGPYTLIPLGLAQITIEGGGFVYFSGTLLNGDLVPVTPTSTLAGAYTSPETDVTDYTVTVEGEALGSAALNAIANYGPGVLDFDLVLSGAPPEGFQYMLANGMTGQDNFSGTMAIPEPATLMALGLGALALLRKRKAMK